MIRRPSLAAGLLGALALPAVGCEDLRHFEGQWAGSISPDPAHQHGFRRDAELRATVTAANRQGLAMTFSVPDRPGALDFKPMRWASSDALGTLSIDGAPLRSYLGFVEPRGEAPFLVVVSLFPEERIAVRLVRGPEETYGVFTLRRTSAEGRTP